MDNDRLRNLLSHVKSHDIVAGDFTDDELRYCTDPRVDYEGDWRCDSGHRGHSR